MRARVGPAAAALLLVAALAGCAALPAASPVGGSASPTPTPKAASATGVPAAEYSLIQEPDDGYQPIYSLIGSAASSIDMTMYELEDQTATAALVAAARRGVVVRVILDAAFNGAKANAADYARLRGGGVQVRYAPAGTIYHQKTLIIDGRVAAISTGNLTARYYTTTRDATVITRNRAQVAAIAAATVSVDFTSEELSDPAVVVALASAARRGVRCEIVMTRQGEFYPELRQVAGAGCSVHLLPVSKTGLYMHEKIVLTDGDALLVGSQNAARGSLRYNRELAIGLTAAEAPEVISRVGSAFAHDYAAALAWQ